MNSGSGNHGSRNTAQTDELELVGMTESERNVDERRMEGVHAV